ncbi:MAG TPA: glycosyltransferase family 4 protein [Tepidisphaeraceae bacterium]|nr:glycosyltransferase family 4 protein [Tepidisphaeraceae bacterium]
MSRILLITSTLPWPLRRNGGGQRTELLRRALRRHGEVDVLAVGGMQLLDGDVTDPMLADNGITGCFVRSGPPAHDPPPWYAKGPLVGLHELLEGWRDRFRPEPAAVEWLGRRMQSPDQRYDLIVGRYLAAALQGGIATDAVRSVPKLLDYDDMEWQTLALALEHEPWPGIKGRIGASLVLRELRNRSAAALHDFQHVWVTSGEDEELLPLDAPSHSVLPNIPYTESSRDTDAPPVRDDAADVLFVGDLQLPPNRDGLERFISEAWPVIRRAVPNAWLRIVGRGLSGEQKERWSQVPGVDVIGFAPDLSQCYADAALCIVPTFFGGGTKIKVLEALLNNRPVVTTRHALRGYDKLNVQGPAVWVGEEMPGLIEGCIKLLTDPATRSAMAERGRAAVLQDFSWDRFQFTVDQAVAPLLNAGGRSEGSTLNPPAAPVAVPA